MKSVILTDRARGWGTWNWGYQKKMKKSHNLGPVLVEVEIWGCLLCMLFYNNAMCETWLILYIPNSLPFTENIKTHNMANKNCNKLQKLRKISDVRNDLLATFYNNLVCVVVDEDTVKFKHWALFREYTHTRHKHSGTNITTFLIWQAMRMTSMFILEKTNTLHMKRLWHKQLWDVTSHFH